MATSRIAKAGTGVIARPRNSGSPLGFAFKNQWKLPRFFESTLDIEAVGFRVFAINMPEQALDLGDLIVPDVVPNFERRKMRPEIAFPLRVFI